MGSDGVAATHRNKGKSTLKIPSNQGYIALFGAKKRDIENQSEYSTKK
jgi:hypothetical protein